MRLEVILIVLLLLDIAADFLVYRQQRQQHREYLDELRRRLGLRSASIQKELHGD